MAKTNEELNILKDEVNTLNKKLKELTPDEFVQVTGGKICPISGNCDVCENLKCWHKKVSS